MVWQYDNIKQIYERFGSQTFSLSQCNLSDLLEIKEANFPMSLYKFYAPTIENISDVQNRLLWLADPTSFNDPNDCKIKISKKFEYYCLQKLLENYNELSYEDKKTLLRFPKEYSIYFRFLQVFEDNPAKAMEYAQEIDSHIYNLRNKAEGILNDIIRDKFRIACFSSSKWDENNYEQLMWAHYTQNHKGFCVEYDITPIRGNGYILSDAEVSQKLDREAYLDLKMIKNGLFPVHYTSRLCQIEPATAYKVALDKYCRSYANNNDVQALRTILTKDLPWQYEKEWRLIVDSSTSNYYNNKIYFPFAKRIYLGNGVSIELRRLLEKTSELLDIDQPL